MTLEEYLQERHPLSTAKNYTRDINIYLHHHPKASRYSYQQVTGYISELRSMYSNANTIARILSAIKKYYHYLHYSGQRKDNPAVAIRLRDHKTTPIQLQDLFSTAELQKLLEPREERYPLLTIRNKAVMSLLVNQGLKPGEIVQLETGHINLNEGTVFIPGSGNTNKRTLALKAEQVMLLHSYISEVRPKLATARTADRLKLLLSKLGQALSIADIGYLVGTFSKLYPERQLTPQTIRMSVIMNLLSAGNDVRVVQVFAGHKRPSATEQYQQSHIEALKTEIQKHHPLQ